MKTIKPKIGDIYKIPISNSRLAYCQFISETNDGYIIRVFDSITDSDHELKIESIKIDKLLFPPVYVGLKAAIREGVIIKIGNIILEDNFVEPKFKSGTPDKEGHVDCWFLIEGDNVIKLGDLPNEYKNIERSGTWSMFDVIKRIENNGKNPYPAWE